MTTDEHGGGEGSDLQTRGELVPRPWDHFRIVRDRPLVGAHFPSCPVHWALKEGDSVGDGDEVLRISASGEILRCERILLNILGRMSGISTNTQKWVSEARNRNRLHRKTRLGASRQMGGPRWGGLTHRLSRADALMIKENDLASLAPGTSDECTD